MGYNTPSPFSQPPPAPPPPPLKTNLPMLYYGLIIVGTAAIVLAMYNLLVIKWTTVPRPTRSPPASIRSSSNSAVIEVIRSTRSRSFDNLDSFKYKKKAGASVAQEQGQGGGCGGVESYECAVCLSVFEDGEEVRKLPACNHSFHASCIDMWLYSHSDCPLCRAPVPITGSWCHRPLSTTPEEHSREVLLNSSVPV